MEHAQISFDLVGSALREDIFSEEGILLLKKGTLLKEIHILLLQKYRFGTTVSVDLNEDVDKHLPSAKPYQSIHSYIKDSFQSFYKKNEINLPEICKRYHSLIELSLCDFSILKVIHTVGKKEEQLYQHSINVGILSAIIGKLLGYKKSDCLLLANMGLFHEIGMLGINKSLTEKKGTLTPDERQQVQKHTEIGYKQLKTIPGLNRLIPLAALLHHERINGSGYPNQRKEGSIPFFVQIISTADHFNTIYMNHQHDENKANFTTIYSLIEEAHNNRLNPAIVIPFVKYMMQQNLFQKVVLSNGEQAQIVFIHENEPYQPLVRMRNGFVDLRRESSLRIEGFVNEVEEDVEKYSFA
ncbi:HD-GYP domain-containing protein [Cytobacillus sp. FJAT-53684]|uniref:HD-GYP domain-containing protein n=1 Tax=Cytobacillus mangrovibacter TaxID=3299024 RepID=A0ABW6JYD3_9BACI